MLGFALADTSRDCWAFRDPDAVFVLLKGGDELHNRNLTQKFEVSRAEAQRGGIAHAKDAKVLVGPIVSVGRWSDLVVSG